MPESDRPTAAAARWNPIFARYCRSRLRPKGLGVALLLAGIAAAFLFFLTRAIGLNRADMDVADAERGPLVPLLFLQGFVLFVLGTGQVAGGMTAEADEGVIDYQRLAPMTPLAKVLGYLFGLPVREWAMFGVTLPFTAWGLWRGEVPASAWMHVYAAVLTAAMLYHLTGLLAGTVLRNRRWAFLVSIGMVFVLYTVIPQLAKFGLVFFKYFTVIPVVTESLPRMLPELSGSALEAMQNVLKLPRPFWLDHREIVFAMFSQGGLIVTFLVMLCRRWRRAESHLMGKAWATGLFLWVQVLLLGNALPLVDSGVLFPSRGIGLVFGGRFRSGWAPMTIEAVAMSALYGVFSLLLLMVLTVLITPSRETQIRGWRRARKLGRTSLPALSDASSALPYVAAMAVAGAVGWFLFTREIVESRWFVGQAVPVSRLLWFAVTMLSAGHACHALLESRGARALAMAAIFAGVVPFLVGAVLGATSDRLLPAAAWVTAISPVSHPAYATTSLLPLASLPIELTRAVPRAWWFWQAVTALVAVRLVLSLRRTRRDIAESAAGPPPAAEPRPAPEPVPRDR